MADQVIRLQPYEYVHILDNNTSKVLLVEGPCCFTLLDHHVNLHPTVQRHVVIPPCHFCEVENPVLLPVDGEEPVCRVGHREVRLSQPPFPLYPGEVASDVKPLRILSASEAVVVQALADYTCTDERTGEVRQRVAGEQWVVAGPGVYTPRIEEVIERNVEPLVVAENECLLLRATASFTDTDGTLRCPGAVWRMSTPGLYFPGPHTELLSVVRGTAVFPSAALRVRALGAFFDANFGAARVAGDRWLVTHDVVSVFLPTEYEEIEATVTLTVVRQWQYCVVLDAVRDGVCCSGAQELRRGPCVFFLQPGESLLGGEVKEAYLLSANEALLVEALSSFTDEGEERRSVSSRWLVRGPRSYIPPLEVRVVEKRETMLLTGSRGVYVRNIRTGRITSVHGKALLLNEDEVLWEKPIDPLVHRLLAAEHISVYDAHALKASEEEVERYTSHAVVSFKVPHSSLVQLYDSSTNTSRVEAGPATVFLAPNEEFTPISLSGGRPKVPDCIHSLCLFLGPDFMADVIEVETLDHARLLLHLAYNWEFDTSNKEHIKRVAFTVSDFVGMACKMLANRIRAAIAGESFDHFHRNSSSLIRQAIFHASSGTTELRGDTLYFPVNGLVITNVDVQSVEPVELNTRNALKKSVQLAVEIITKSQENEASHQAMLLEQEAKGAVELQFMKDKASAEAERVTLLQVATENTAIELSGAAKAQALAESEARLVELQAELDVTGTRCAAHEVVADAELNVQRMRMESELAHRRAMNDLAVAKAKALADIEATKTEKVFKALGNGTLEAIARAGPELKAKLLQALGLKGFLLTDGAAPVNLMGMADRIVQVPRAK
ncbi:putative major vault protein [Trypanosoma grayi]|uniref:putative major vault protein n=1 Tax=Trypanosoma grayi TaxID=71804 RepID=UPI0004F411DA|nr:putative major vault protein [Trypanosoma grayi]KEG06436.1 putative major vault protein [Trypanosoma grayi]